MHEPLCVHIQRTKVLTSSVFLNPSSSCSLREGPFLKPECVLLVTFVSSFAFSKCDEQHAQKQLENRPVYLAYISMSQSRKAKEKTWEPGIEAEDMEECYLLACSPWLSFC